MRIAEISPPWERVPPQAYGGIEAVVGTLTDGLVRRGHDVTLYATGDSVTTANLRWVCPEPLRAAGVLHPLSYELSHIARLLGESDEYDLIHNHCGEFFMAFSQVIRTPVLTTLHGPMARETEIVWNSYTGYYNTISDAARDGFPNRGYLGVVYNGIEVDRFPFQREKANYLLFLGRVSEEKGTHLAIDVARALNRPLIIAGKVDRVDRSYFEQQVAPKIDGSLIQYVGEASFAQKCDLFANARCLLHPVTWPEPFGLVMAEAMACGTPVIGLRQGSIPEVVENEVTGFVVDTVEEMTAAADRIDVISPELCRERVARLFSADQMVSNYERVFEQICPSPSSEARSY